MGTAFAEIRAKGWNALVKELGHSGATKFILLYERGEGDYTKERKDMLKGVTIEKVVEDMKKRKRETSR